jgi:hypothetical protein
LLGKLLLLVVLVHGSLNNQTTTNTSSNSSIDKFLKVDGLYYSGNLSGAKALNSSISCTNTIESLYKSYYSLYDKFVTNSFSTSDNNALSYIAELCPGTNGTDVYKARALFNYINQAAKVYSNSCLQNNFNREIGVVEKFDEGDGSFEIELYPNPTENFVNLYSKAFNEEIDVKVTDVNGKLLISEKVNLINHIGLLNVNLKSGIYFLSFTNKNNETKIKKLIISK